MTLIPSIPQSFDPETARNLAESVDHPPNLNSTAYLTLPSNGVRTGVTSRFCHFLRRSCALSLISVGAARSDCPWWTNLARGRLGHLLQSRVCLFLFFCRILTNDLFPDPCAEPRNVRHPRPAAIINFRLRRIPPVTFAAATSTTAVESLANAQKLPPFVIQHVLRQMASRTTQHCDLFPFISNDLTLPVCYSPLLVVESRLTLENVLPCSHASFCAKGPADGSKFSPLEVFLFFSPPLSFDTRFPFEIYLRTKPRCFYNRPKCTVLFKTSASPLEVCASITPLPFRSHKPVEIPDREVMGLLPNNFKQGLINSNHYFPLVS